MALSDSRPGASPPPVVHGRAGRWRHGRRGLPQRHQRHQREQRQRQEQRGRHRAVPAPGAGRCGGHRPAGGGRPGRLRAPSAQRARAAAGRAGDGTPEQVHLTWGRDPATSVVVSWATPGQAVAAAGAAGRAAAAGRRVIPARARTLHRRPQRRNRLDLPRRDPRAAPGHQLLLRGHRGQRLGAADAAAGQRAAPPRRAGSRSASPASATWPRRTPTGCSPTARAPTRSRAVESFQPLFHLLNGDLCYADLNPTVQPEVWRDFGNNNQASAANRPWMPCPGNHEIEFDNGPQGFTSYLTRYLLPDNGVPGFRGYWYSFRVGSAAVRLAGGGRRRLPGRRPARVRAGRADPGGQHRQPGHPGRAPRSTSAATAGARRPPGCGAPWRRPGPTASVDWIIVQMHQDACSSSATGNGSDLGIREEWLPLFDQYQVDLVLCGHDHDYERSFPVRGYDSMAGQEVATGAPVQTLRPHPVTTTPGGPVRHLAGHRAPDPGRRRDQRPAGRVRRGHQRRAAPGQGVHQAEPARPRHRPPARSPGPRPTRSRMPPGPRCATRPPATGSPCSTSTRASRAGRPASRSRYYHAVGADPTNPNTGVTGTPNPNYTKFETFTLLRPRSGRSGGHPHETPNT